MRTPEPARRLFAGSLRSEKVAGSPLGIGFLRELQGNIQEWLSPLPKDADADTTEFMRMSLLDAAEAEVAPIGTGIHRPYRVVFHSGMDAGPVTTRQAVLKTVYCQYENKRYCASVDLNITGPEREILSYEMDRVLGFDLVPPVAGREIAGVGYGSVQAWVNQPTAWEWLSKGYDYREDKTNPWLHRLAAFDFIRGEIDRHANNWIMDEEHRVYAIDNGYSIVKGDDRTWMRSSAGKHLVGTPIHPSVENEIASINEEAVAAVLAPKGFIHGEVEGVLKRIKELKGLDRWTKLGNLW